MHEFSIAQNIIEIVEETIRASNKKKVTCVELEVGNFSGVEIPALETAIDCIAPGSVLEGSRVQINVIRGTAVCRKCRHRYDPESILTPCPECNSYAPEIISGKEMIVKSITVE